MGEVIQRFFALGFLITIATTPGYLAARWLSLAGCCRYAWAANRLKNRAAG